MSSFDNNLRTGIFLDMWFLQNLKKYKKEHKNFHFRSFPDKTNEFIFF